MGAPVLHIMSRLDDVHMRDASACIIVHDYITYSSISSPVMQRGTKYYTTFFIVHRRP